MIKNIMFSFMRTSMVTALCIVMWLFSSIIFNFLPGVLYVIAITLYYLFALLIYFIIASDDIVSTVIGILISIAYFILYILNIISDVNIFLKLLFIFGIVLGVAQTIHSVSYRYELITLKAIKDRS